MRILRRLLLAVAAGCIVLALAVRFGVPWYVNSGRATPRVERVLGARLGGAVQVEGLRMDSWRVLHVDEVRARRPGSFAGSGEDIRVSVPSVLSALRGRKVSVEAARVRAILPPATGTPPPAGAEGWWSQLRELERLVRVRADEYRVERSAPSGTVETLAVGSVDARNNDGAFDITITTTVEPVAATVAGTVRYRPGRLQPEHARLTFSADGGRLAGLAGIAGLVVDGVVTGTLDVEAGVATVQAAHPGFRWNAVEVGAGEVHVAARPVNLLLPVPMDVTVRSERLRLGEVAAPAGVELRAAAEVEPVGRRVRWTDLELEWDAGVVFGASGEAVVGGDGADVRAVVEVPDLPLAVWAEYLPALGRRIRSETGTAWVTGAVGATVTCTSAPDGIAATADWRWTDGGVLLSDFRQAAGLAVALRTSVAPDTGGTWRVDTTGRLDRGEVLWDAFYADVAARPIPFEGAARLAADRSRLDALHATIRLDGLGRWDISGDVQLDAPTSGGFTIQGEAIDMAAVARDLVVPLLAESRPWTSDVTAAGGAALTMDVIRGDAGPILEGAVHFTNVTVSDPSDRLAVRGLYADVPFRLGPGATPSATAPARAGEVRFASAQAGPVPLNGARLPLRVWNNEGEVSGAYTTAVFGGTLTVSEIAGRRLFMSDRRWTAAVAVADVDLAAATTAFETLPLDGRLNGQLAPVEFAEDQLNASGELEARVYGGVLRLTHAGIEDVSSPYRTYMADVDFTGINLDLASSSLEFGRITGLFDGSVHGLRIQAGQPAAFDAEFHTVPTRGVSQTISLEAVNNISVLGTGRGIGGLMTRGLAQFFDQYRYEHIGFRCTLEHDQFDVGGGELGPEGEFFVRGTVLPPRINVIRRSQTGTVNFMEMVRRFQKLQLPTGGAPAPAAKGTDS